MKKKVFPVFIKIVGVALIIVTIVIVSLFGIQKIKLLLPHNQKADLEEIYEGIQDTYTYVLLEDEILSLSHYPKMVEGQLYLPIDFVTQYLNPNFYWDAKEDVLTYTNQQNVIRMQTDDLTYFVNDEPVELDMPILMLEDSMAYIPSELLLRFSSYQFTYVPNIDLLMVDDLTQDATYGVITQKTAYLRIGLDEESRYLKKMYHLEKVKIYGESDLWYKVRTEQGYMGYVLKEAIEQTTLTVGQPEDISSNAHNPKKQYDSKINLVWHQVTNTTANRNLEAVMADTKGIDVISPTWFALKDIEGNISNIADIAYVTWAHERGYQVWALFSNSFDADITHEVLSSTEKREKVIKQILALAAIYKLDGINLDFENVAAEDGPYFVQFVKELTPYLKNQELIVSADMYVPKPWTEHYNRGELGKIIDYLIIMGYDEHWSTSPISGSVASIGFVEQGIRDTLASVPKEKVILGLPYYTRLWKEEVVDGEIKVSSKAYSMEGAYALLIENGAIIAWDEIIGQYYGEYSIEGITYKIWLEEEKSIEEKMKLAANNELAGIAGWKLGLEKPAIWDVLELYLKD